MDEQNEGRESGMLVGAGRSPWRWGAGLQTPELARAARTVNVVEDYRRAVQPLVDRLQAQPEVDAVVLLGGVARTGYRRFADEGSDIDVAVFLSVPEAAAVAHLPRQDFVREVQPLLPDWLPNFKFRIPGRADIPFVDVYQQLLEWEERPGHRWDLGKVEAYAGTSELVVAKSRRTPVLIGRQVRLGLEALRAATIKAVAMTPVVTRFAVDGAVARGFWPCAHELLSEMLDGVIEAVYAANDWFPPHRKWRLVLLHELPWQPSDLPGRVGDILLVREHDERDVRRRQAALLDLTGELERHLRERCPWFPDQPYEQAVTAVFADRQLRRSTSADALVAPHSQYDERMHVDAWNQHNWLLGGPSEQP